MYSITFLENNHIIVQLMQIIMDPVPIFLMKDIKISNQWLAETF